MRTFQSHLSVGQIVIFLHSNKVFFHHGPTNIYRITHGIKLSSVYRYLSPTCSVYPVSGLEVFLLSAHLCLHSYFFVSLPVLWVYTHPVRDILEGG